MRLSAARQLVLDEGSDKGDDNRREHAGHPDRDHEVVAQLLCRFFTLFRELL